MAGLVQTSHREQMLLLPFDLQFLLRFLIHLLDGRTLISRLGWLYPRRRRSVARQGGLSGKLLCRPGSGGLGLRAIIGQGDSGVEAQTGQDESSGSSKFHRAPPVTVRRQCCRRSPLNARVGRLCLVRGAFSSNHWWHPSKRANVRSSAAVIFSRTCCPSASQFFQPACVRMDVDKRVPQDFTIEATVENEKADRHHL